MPSEELESSPILFEMLRKYPHQRSLAISIFGVNYSCGSCLSEKVLLLFFFPPSLLSTISYRVCRLCLDFSSRNKFSNVPFQEPQLSRQIMSSPESSRTESIVLRRSSSKTGRGCSRRSVLSSGDNLAFRVIMGHSSLQKHLLRCFSATAHRCS